MRNLNNFFKYKILRLKRDEEWHALSLKEKREYLKKMRKRADKVRKFSYFIWIVGGVANFIWGLQRFYLKEPVLGLNDLLIASLFFMIFFVSWGDDKILRQAEEGSDKWEEIAIKEGKLLQKIYSESFYKNKMSFKPKRGRGRPRKIR